MLDNKPFENLLQRLKDEGKYRVFNDILRERGEYPNAIWYGKYNIKNIVNWCSNDYLGMSQHKVVLDAMHTALDQTGAGSGGTRNIAGTSHYHVALEHELATLHSKESALLFTSAYVANEWTLVALKRIIPDIVYVSDSKNHASLIQGIRHSGAEKKIFRHNDLEHLEELLRDVKGTPCIVFESVYSMDGYVSKIPEIVALAEKYNAITPLHMCMVKLHKCYGSCAQNSTVITLPLMCMDTHHKCCGSCNNGSPSAPYFRRSPFAYIFFLFCDSSVTQAAPHFLEFQAPGFGSRF